MALASYQNTLDELASVRTRLTRTNAYQQEQTKQMTAERAELVSRRAARQSLLARLESDIDNKSNQRARLEADQARLEQLLATLQKRAGALDGEGFAASKGRLPWPIAGKVQHGYGQRHSDGRLRWHGTRFAAAVGSEVTAVFRGRVVFANWLRGYGLLTIIDHGSGYMTLYGHADALTKTAGDWVEGGEIIGRAGQSGGQSTDGLYFEVRHDGKHTNPSQWLADDG